MKTVRECVIATIVALGMTVISICPRSRVLSAAQSGGESASAQKPSDAPAGNAENGKKIFTRHGCYQCHGREGQGSVMTGPRIAPDPVPFDVFARYLRKPLGEMPPYTALVVPDQELADIYAFLQSRPRPPSAKSIPSLN